MRKSYHSMVVPIALAATTVRIANFFSSFPVAVSDTILFALPVPSQPSVMVSDSRGLGNCLVRRDQSNGRFTAGSLGRRETALGRVEPVMPSTTIGENYRPRAASR